MQSTHTTGSRQSTCEPCSWPSYFILQVTNVIGLISPRLGMKEAAILVRKDTAGSWSLWISNQWVLWFCNVNITIYGSMFWLINLVGCASVLKVKRPCFQSSMVDMIPFLIASKSQITFPCLQSMSLRAHIMRNYPFIWKGHQYCVFVYSSSTGIRDKFLWYGAEDIHLLENHLGPLSGGRISNGNCQFALSLKWERAASQLWSTSEPVVQIIHCFCLIFPSQH